MHLGTERRTVNVSGHYALIVGAYTNTDTSTSTITTHCTTHSPTSPSHPRSRIVLCDHHADMSPAEPVVLIQPPNNTNLKLVSLSGENLHKLDVTGGGARLSRLPQTVCAVWYETCVHVFCVRVCVWFVFCVCGSTCARELIFNREVWGER